jgi:hypothetical protein
MKLNLLERWFVNSPMGLAFNMGDGRVCVLTSTTK